ncbi:hypothetical protein VTN77DRAFT_2071 [Rasamsonia byssochlamydoides]|uniref:uncharacterized protein n=1 Tax=Rasamsonia byssochlamydoides TaxID=89139 RepID=UPI0037439F2E
MADNDGSDIKEILSDESSFYGDEETKDSLEDRVGAYDLLHYWSHVHPHQLSTIAHRHLTSSTAAAGAAPAEASPAKPPAPHRRHPHDGLSHCWQVTESVAEFPARLPPSTTRTDDIGRPWIHVRNPLEPPDHGGTNIADLVARGTALLHAFENEKAKLEADHAKARSRASAPLTRKLNVLRRQLERDIFAVAREAGVVTGKWMLFPTADRVDEAWAAVAEATVKGDLGVEAKVATDTTDDGAGGGDSSGRLIAVYTRDFEDKEDVRRVLLKLVDLGLVDEEKRPIYYKCDAYTYLEIKSKNPYGLKASMFSSRDVLAGKF